VVEHVRGDRSGNHLRGIAACIARKCFVQVGAAVLLRREASESGGRHRIGYRDDCESAFERGGVELAEQGARSQWSQKLVAVHVGDDAERGSCGFPVTTCSGSVSIAPFSIVATGSFVNERPSFCSAQIGVVKTFSFCGIDFRTSRGIQHFKLGKRNTSAGSSARSRGCGYARPSPAQNGAVSSRIAVWYSLSLSPHAARCAAQNRASGVEVRRCRRVAGGFDFRLRRARRQLRVTRVPVGRLLISVADAQHCDFTERAPDHLHAERQPPLKPLGSSSDGPPVTLDGVKTFDFCQKLAVRCASSRGAGPKPALSSTS